MALRRVLKYGLAAGALFTTAGTVSVLHQNDWNLSSIGVVRISRAAVAVAKITVDYKWTFYWADKLSSDYNHIKSQAHYRAAEKLLDMCKANGGVFIKVGQHVAALNYLVPDEYIQTLKVLHSHAPQSPIADVFQVIQEDLHKEPSELFEEFEVEPIGAASLAQVHKAKLKSGNVVAVKVQHKNVKAQSVQDIKTMEVLVKMVSRIFPDFDFIWLVELMKRNLPRELDFIQEGHNAEKVEKMFSKFRWLKVPQIHWDLTTERILIMEYCEGGDVSDKEYMIKHGIPVHQVSQRVGQLYSEMIFIQGYIHCDPHPGNILVQKTAKGESQIILLDHGLYTTLTDQFRIQYCGMFMALIKADVKGLEEWGKQFGVGNLYQILAAMMSARSYQAVVKGIDKKGKSSEERNQIQDFVTGHLVDIAIVLNRIPRDMLLVFKTNDLLRGIDASLGTGGASTSFIEMTKCCIRAVSDDQLKKCETWCGKLKIRSYRSFTLFKISFYQIIVYFGNSITNSWLLRKFFLSR